MPSFATLRTVIFKITQVTDMWYFAPITTIPFSTVIFYELINTEVPMFICFYSNYIYMNTHVYESEYTDLSSWGILADRQAVSAQVTRCLAIGLH